MSIKLAEGEKVLRTYVYGKVKQSGLANSGDSDRTLYVTNQRIIHRIAGQGLGKEHLVVNEMPIKSAKYVTTQYGKRSYPFLLILGIICAMIAIGGFAGSSGWVGGFGLIFAALFIAIYIFKKDYMITCQIFNEGYVSTAFYCSSRSGNSLTRGAFGALAKAGDATTINVKVSVNNEVAKLMADELGYVIHAAQNGDLD